MRRNAMIRNLFVMLVVSALAGCKLLLIVPPGGFVQSYSGGNCYAATVCEFDIVDGTFDDTLRAFPAAGYHFSHWYDAEGFLCAGSTDSECPVSSVPLDGVIPDEFIEAAPNVYAMPVFTDRAPILDTVFAPDGREWAQPVHFGGLSWQDIEAVCPQLADGVCTGSLNGWDMTGWIWADAGDVSALFNAYGLDPSLAYPYRQSSMTCESEWLPSVRSDGWILTFHYSNNEVLMGFVREMSGSQGVWLYVGALTFVPDCPFSLDEAYFLFEEVYQPYQYVGGFFYRAG